jgi:hypothetical protein
VTETSELVNVQPVPARPLSWIRWQYSLIFAVALLGLLATIIYNLNSDPESINLQIVDHASGQAIAGAEVRIGDKTWKSDQDGTVMLPASAKSGAIVVTSPGFQDWYSDIGLERMGQLTIQLRPGNQAVTAVPTPEQTVAVISASPPAATPAATAESDIQIDGKIADASGKGIQGARIVLAGLVDITGKDGFFSLALPVEDSGSLVARIIAPGYLEQEQNLEAAPDRASLEFVMEPHKIKAIYLNPNISTTDEDVDRLINMIDTTELNAVVIDIKEELIFYDSKVKFFEDAGTIQPRIDLDAMLTKFRDHGIYTIARLVVFKDSVVAEKRPDLAVLNNQTGGLWRDMNGVAWVNPMSHELWEANTDLALEAAERGFDEIQFDYVRFPTDGDLTTMDFGLENTQDVRERSIEKFLQMAQEKVNPTGAKLSADVFGYTMLVEDDLGIGQNFAQLAQYLDYLSPMIYPSHFPDGSIDVDGQPNDFPYETIEISTRLGREKLGGDASKIRPWLQDFSFFDMTPYGDAEVRAQIDATNDVGTSGWMLWDPNNTYHPGALEPEGATPMATLPAAPAASPTGSATPANRRRRRR